MSTETAQLQSENTLGFFSKKSAMVRASYDPISAAWIGDYYATGKDYDFVDPRKVKKYRKKHAALLEALHLQENILIEPPDPWPSYLSTKNYYDLFWIMDRCILFLLLLGQIIQKFQKAPLVGPTIAFILTNLCLFSYSLGLLVEFSLMVKNLHLARKRLEAENPSLSFRDYTHALSENLKHFFQRRGRTPRLRTMILWLVLQLGIIALIPVILNPSTALIGLGMTFLLYGIGYLYDLIIEVEEPYSLMTSIREEVAFLERDLRELEDEIRWCDEASDVQTFIEKRNSELSILSEDSFHRRIGDLLEKHQFKDIKEIQTTLSNMKSTMETRREKLQEKIQAQKDQMLYGSIAMAIVVTGFAISGVSVFFTPLAPILIPVGASIAALGLVGLLYLDFKNFFRIEPCGGTKNSSESSYEVLGSPSPTFGTSTSP